MGVFTPQKLANTASQVYSSPPNAWFISTSLYMESHVNNWWGNLSVPCVQYDIPSTFVKI